ncbi:MAG: cysteine peptidase family C39 domain-containing protein [Planctomycetales bacterium]|nr:cysteine peptidase family C39 domain-containing protein [Planctomycetales bacterium]
MWFNRLVLGLTALLVGISLIIGLLLWNSNHLFTRTQVSSSNLTSRERSRLACGPVCVAIASQLTGVYLAPERLISECKLSPNGSSLADLVELFNRHEMDAWQRNLTWGDLVTSLYPAILHVDGDHYVVANPNELEKDSEGRTTSVRVYDPNSAAAFLTRDDIESRWDGLAVVFVPALPQVDLKVAKWWVDVGMKDNSESAQYNFPIWNSSKGRVQIKIFDTSCNCTKATIDRETADIGEQFIFDGAIELDGKRGPFRERVAIALSGNPMDSPFTITLAGTALGKVEYSASQLPFGELDQFGSKQLSIVVRDSGDGSLRITNIDSRLTPPGVVECSVLSHQRLDRSNINSVRSKHPVAQEGDWLINIKVESRRSKYRGKVTGTLNCTAFSGTGTHKEQLELACPVLGVLK